MTKLEKIERDVAALSADDLNRFRERFNAYDAECFDAAIEEDAASGRLDAFADKALADFNAGLTR